LPWLRLIGAAASGHLHWQMMSSPHALDLDLGTGMWTRTRTWQLTERALDWRHNN